MKKHGKTAYENTVLRGAAAILTALALLFSCGCAEQKAAAERGLFAMDTYMELKAYGDNAPAALAEAAELIMRLDSLLSATNASSEIYAVNHAEGSRTQVSPETFDIISRALGVSRELNGAFSITLYPVLRAWGFTTGEYRIPDDDELAALLRFADDSAIELDEQRLTVRLPAGAELDLGAIAKGYAGDLTARIMRANGVDSALLDMGSSTIVAIGKKPEGTAWRIAVKDPQDPDEFAGTAELCDMSISTSGGCERYFTGEDGETYWHIIDPATGRPARSGLLSATVICQSAMLGDALSTALFVMGAERAEEYWRAVGGFEFILITEEGGMILTPGAAELFTPSGRYEAGEFTIVPAR